MANQLDRLEALAEAARYAVDEAQRAMEKFKPFNSSHEGFAVLREEVDEMWDAIKANDLPHARKEAIQVAAMALRYIAETPKTKHYEGGK